ncbi:MAG: hypothetical protein K8I04_00205 [Gammaproteobacteria bacterium]|nr:hypothetical protein [Gammaproteobacteria bacterium]
MPEQGHYNWLRNKDNLNKLAAMHKIVAKALIFFILFANLAWAADMDEIGIAHDAAKISISSIDGPGGPSDDGGLGHDGVKNGTCDHCCHGSAHYVGFPPGAVTAFQYCASATHTLWLTAHYSRDTEPPLPPPNI